MMIILLCVLSARKKHRERVKRECGRGGGCNRAYVMNVLTNYLKFCLKNSFCIFFGSFSFQRGGILIYRGSGQFFVTMNQLNILNVFHTQQSVATARTTTTKRMQMLAHVIQKVNSPTLLRPYNVHA